MYQLQVNQGLFFEFGLLYSVVSFDVFKYLKSEGSQYYIITHLILLLWTFVNVHASIDSLCVEQANKKQILQSLHNVYEIIRRPTPYIRQLNLKYFARFTSQISFILALECYNALLRRVVLIFFSYIFHQYKCFEFMQNFLHVLHSKDYFRSIQKFRSYRHLFEKLDAVTLSYTGCLKLGSHQKKCTLQVQVFLWLSHCYHTEIPLAVQFISWAPARK